MRSQRTGISVRVHLFVVEVVVAHRIRAEFRVVVLGCQHQGCAAAPAAHELRGQQLLTVGAVSVVSDVVAEQRHVLLQAPVRHVAPIAGQHLWLRKVGDRPVLVGVAENELTRLERSARAGSGLLTRSLDHRLRQPVAEPEVVMGVVERRCGVQIQERQASNAVAACHQLVVHPGGPAHVRHRRARTGSRSHADRHQPARRPSCRAGCLRCLRGCRRGRPCPRETRRESSPVHSSGTPRARRPFQVNASVTHRFGAVHRGAGADAADPRRGSAPRATPGRRPVCRTTGTRTVRSSPGCGSAGCAEYRRSSSICSVLGYCIWSSMSENAALSSQRLLDLVGGDVRVLPVLQEARDIGDRGRT